MIEGIQSSQLFLRLRDVLSDEAQGQLRLNKIVSLIAQTLGTEVCSIYLRRSDNKLELSATKGLDQKAVHQTVLNANEGLVGRVAQSGKSVNTSNAPDERYFSYRPETGEDIYRGFCGVPIQRLGRVAGVLVVQTSQSRKLTRSELGSLEIIAIVLAEMNEIGVFTDNSVDPAGSMRKGPMLLRGIIGQEGVAAGQVVLHNPTIQIKNPVAEDPETEKKRLNEAFQQIESEISALHSQEIDEETQEILETFGSISRDKGFRKRLKEDIKAGLSAEAAVEVEQSRLRARMGRITNAYIRERMSDIDDLCNRLLRALVGASIQSNENLPEAAILVARNLGPAELMEYGRSLKAIVLSEGSVGSHATIVARAWSIPLIIQAKNAHIEARTGDFILVDGEQGVIHIRPDENVSVAFQAKIEMSEKASAAFAELKDLPSVTKDGVYIDLCMNAGLIADLPSLEPSGAMGVGLFRTELQFLVRQTIPKRSQMADLYAHVMNAAGDKPVTFRTLDMGSDKVVANLAAKDEPNPAMGWRAIRMGLDRTSMLKMQIQCLLRGAKGRDLRIMFPFVAQGSEFESAKAIVEQELERYVSFRHLAPKSLSLGAMLETPSLAFATDQFFESVDFLSVGGNDLKMFFFAADRENERVRRRYDTLNTSYLNFLRQLINRCQHHDNLPVSFCGEDAGKPLEALAFAAIGFRHLSMRPASIGKIKFLLRQVNLAEVSQTINSAMNRGDISVRDALEAYLSENGISYSHQHN